jgi:hypothetical protein
MDRELRAALIRFRTLFASNNLNATVGLMARSVAVSQFVFVQEVDDCAGRLATGLPLFPAERGTTVAHSSHLILGARDAWRARRADPARLFANNQ